MSRAAVAILHGSDNSILGIVELEELPGRGTWIHGIIEGASPGPHGLHIHEWGDMRRSCESMGSHYNPFGKLHGPRESNERHLGDLGNITFDTFGAARFSFIDPFIQLSGPYSVVGRGLVLHENQDDLGWGDDEESLKTGNSGRRIACGIIALKK